MRTSSLESKTIRPGLAAYSFYRSDRRPVSRTQTKKAKKKPVAGTPQRGWPIVITLVLVFGVFLGLKTASGDGGSAPTVPGQAQQANVLATLDTSNHCEGIKDKTLVISISERHLWACQTGKSVYDSNVITGMESHEETKTPLGSYRIYAKQTKTVLTGSDSTGAWNAPVDYWLPFLDNQFGTYGFHDATWRNDTAFGKVDPHSEQASHGCVELPLSASKWVYEWSSVGTPVTIKA